MRPRVQMPVQIQRRFVPMTPPTPSGSPPRGARLLWAGVPHRCVWRAGAAQLHTLVAVCKGVVDIWRLRGTQIAPGSAFATYVHTVPPRMLLGVARPRMGILMAFCSACGVVWARRWLTTEWRGGLRRPAPRPFTPMWHVGCPEFSWNGCHVLWVAETYDTVASCTWTVRSGGRSCEAGEVMGVGFHTRVVRRSLSLPLPPCSLSSCFLSTSTAVPGFAPCAGQQVNLLPFPEREGTSGPPCPHRPMSSREAAGQVRRRSICLLPGWTRGESLPAARGRALCLADRFTAGEGRRRDDTHGFPRDGSRDPADGGKSGGGGQAASRLVPGRCQGSYMGGTMV